MFTLSNVRLDSLLAVSQAGTSRALVGLPEADLLRLEEELDRLHGVAVGREFTHYPGIDEVVQFLRATDPDILLVSTVELAQMELPVAQATQTLPNVQIVLVDSLLHSGTLKRAMQMGVRECLTIPSRPGDCAGLLNAA